MRIPRGTKLEGDKVPQGNTDLGHFFSGGYTARSEPLGRGPPLRYGNTGKVGVDVCVVIP